MQAHKLSTNSWHFYLANWGRRRVYHDDAIDICSYIRKVIAGTFNLIGVTVFMGLFVGIIIACYGHLAVWIYDCYVAGQLVYLPAPAFIAMLMSALILIAVGHSYYEHWAEARAEARKDMDIKPREPGFVSLVAKKFKSKTCFMVEFNQDK